MESGKLEELRHIARGIAAQFGPNCEVVVHDLSQHPDHTIVAIENGHVSGRSVGSTVDILGSSRAIDDEARKVDFVNLYATTPSGQQIKSSTFHLIGEDYDLALGINYDFTSLVFANRVLLDLMSADADLQSAMWRGGEDRLGELFDECLAAIGKPVNALSKADRLRLIALLDQKAAFSFRKSVPYVSQRLGVSRYTVYKYLNENSARKEENEHDSE